MIVFSQNPDQWELFKKERPSTATDEIIGWAKPVSAFRRTRQRGHRVGWRKDQEGPASLIFYRSANFDEEVF